MVAAVAAAGAGWGGGGVASIFATKKGTLFLCTEKVGSLSLTACSRCSFLGLCSLGVQAARLDWGQPGMMDAAAAWRARSNSSDMRGGPPVAPPSPTGGPSGLTAAAPCGR